MEPYNFVFSIIYSDMFRLLESIFMFNIKDSILTPVPCIYIIHNSTKYCTILLLLVHIIYVVGCKSFRPDQLFKVTEIKQLCYFSA